MEITFSILIAAYNAEKSLAKCLDSVVQRKKADYEVVIINDGSSDNTLKICEDYCEKFPQCHVYSCKNSGIAGARNLGLKYAKGKYIIFCDSDDKYCEENFNKLLDSADNLLQKSDLIAFNFYDVWADGSIDKVSHYENNEIAFDEFSQKLDFISSSVGNNTCGYAIWDKIYKKEIIDSFNIHTPNRDEIGNRDDWGEDLVFNLQYFMRCNSIKVIDSAVYLLSKHGMPEEQNENACLNRIFHMANYMKFLFDCDALAEIKKDFYKVFLWHFKRFLYLDIQNVGVEKTRNAVISCDKYSFLKELFETAVKDKAYFMNRFGKTIGEEYLLILRYLLNGNLTAYKIKNAVLWKIKNK